MGTFLAIVAVVMIFSLNKRVGILENQVISLMKKGGRVPHEERENVEGIALNMNAKPLEEGMEANITYQEYTQSEGSVTGVNEPSPFFEWIKKDFMVKLGALLLLIAFGWFVSYAFINDWIGPVGRITLGILAGISLLALGAWRITTHPHQGGIFSVLGSTIVILTLYAAREIYGFFNPYSALGLMLLSIIFIAFMSVRYNRHSLALSSLFLASIAPFFTAAPSPDVVELSLYLLIITLGTLWAVFVRSWSTVLFMNFVIVFFYGLPYLTVSGGREQDIALMFAFLFTGIFFFANLVGMMRNTGEDNNHAHIALGAGTGFYLMLWVLSVAQPEWQSLLLVIWMLVFSIGGYVAYAVCAHTIIFYIYAAISVVLLGTATALELDGQVLTLAFTLEITALVLLVLHFVKNIRIASILAWLYVIPIILSFESIDARAWDTGIIHAHSFMIFFMGAVLALMGTVLTEREKAVDGEAETGHILTIGSALYGLTLIWLVFHVPVYFTYEIGTMCALIVYTLIGIGLYIVGKQKDEKALRVSGMLLLGFVIMRLLFVEVWSMELGGRIITFLVIGLLLMSTAFIHREKKRVE